MNKKRNRKILTGMSLALLSSIGIVSAVATTTNNQTPKAINATTSSNLSIGASLNASDITTLDLNKSSNTSIDVGFGLKNAFKNNIEQPTTLKTKIINLKNRTPITQKDSLDAEVLQLKPSEVVYKINQLAPNGNVDNQNTTYTYLQKFFNFGDITIDGSTNLISSLRAYGDSTKGTLTINFFVKDSNGRIICQAQGSFTIATGVTSVAKFSYNDASNDFNAIKTKLSDPAQAKEYLTSTGILQNISQEFTTIDTASNVINWDSNNEVITITLLKVKNAIGPTNLQDMTFNEGIKIYPNNHSNSPATTATINYAYLTDPAFVTGSTAQTFADLVKTNKTSSDFINKIVTITPLPLGTTISIASDSAILVKQQTVEITFTVDKYYDQYGQQQDTSTTFKITYSAFPTASKVTIINAVNYVTASNKDFAYQYDQSTLQEIVNNDINGARKIIKNPVTGSTATISEVNANNRTGVVTAKVSLNKYYDENGQEQSTAKEETVSFVVPKTINQNSLPVRNTTVVTETVRELDQKIASNEFNWAEKYISISGALTNPQTAMSITNVVKEAPAVALRANSGSVVDNTWYKASVTLTNYIANDETYSLQTGTSSAFYVYINAKMDLATKLKDNVYTDGLTVTDADASISNVTVADLVGSSQDSAKVELIKQWIVNKNNAGEVFENYVTNMTTSNITSISFNNGSDANSVEVTLTINNAYGIDGNVTSEEFRFQIHNLAADLWTLENKQIVINASSISGADKFASDFAKNVASGQFGSYIDTELAKNDTSRYFENLPKLEESDHVVQVNYVVDDLSGEIIVTYKLPKFYVKGVVQTPNNPSNNPNAFIYEARITGFKLASSTPFSGMNRNIDVAGGQLNNSINTGSLVSAYDYKTNIANAVKNFLSTSGSSVLPSDKLTETIAAANNLVTEGQFELNISKPVRTVDSIVATVTVKSSALATASGDNTWNNGYVFTLNNAKYANTDVQTSSYENLTISLDEFNALNSNKADQLLKLNTTIDFTSPALYSGSEYSNPTNLQIDATGDNVSGKALVKITFPKFYKDNKEVDNYIVAFNFSFKPTAAIGNQNYIKDDAVAATTLDSSWEGKNIIEIIAGINSGSINLNGIINAKKNDILNEGIISQFPNLQLSVPNDPITKKPDFTISPNGDYILVNVEINNNGNKSIEQLKVGPFTTTIQATNPTAVGASSLPSGLTYDNLETKVTEVGKNKGAFINYNDGKTINNEAIAITKAEVEFKETVNAVDVKKAAFIDFTFNGVYLKNNDIKSFVSNYVVKLRIDFDASQRAINSQIVWSGNQDQYISAKHNIGQKLDWILFAIFGSFFFILIAAYATRVLYRRNKLNKTK